MSNSIHKILTVYKEAKVSDRFVDLNTKLKDVIERAKAEDVLYKYNDSMFVCCYKTKCNDKSAIMILFSIDTTKPSLSSAASSDRLSQLIEVLEKYFEHVYTKCENYIDKNKRSFQMLQYVVLVDNTELDGESRL